MRAFARPMALAGLSLEARVLYTGFIVFVLMGLATSIWLFVDDGFGLSQAAVSTYYRGDEGAAAADLADIHVEKSARQVMETFHFHLFTVPLLLLVIGHIFMMCSLSTRTKVLVLLIAAASTFVHLIGPLLVRFGSASFAPLFAGLFTASALAMAASWGIVLVVPLVQMWRPVSPLTSSTD